MRWVPSHHSTIRAWNTANGKALGAIRGHTGSVMCLHRNETSLASGGEDKSVKGTHRAVLGTHACGVDH